MISILNAVLLLPLVICTPLTPRQFDVPPPTATPTSNSGSQASTGSPSLNIIIPLAAAIAGGILVAFIFRYRWEIRKIFSPSSRSNDTALRSLTAETLAGRSVTRAGGNTASTGATANADASNATSTDPNAARARRSRGRGRGVRRTESGRSVRTLPEYTKDAGDEELVLVRRRSGSMSDESYIAEEDEEESIRGRDASPHRLEDQQNGRNESDITDGSISTNIDTTRNTDNNENSPPVRTGSLARRGWGEAPTYLEAMSSPNPDEHPPTSPSSRGAEVPEPKRSTAGTLRRTASGIRELLVKPFGPDPFRAPSTTTNETQIAGRPRAESQASLLHATSSRFSTVSNSSYTSPWTSTASLLISPPVPNSARRASFNPEELPKKGLSDHQMKFLASSEAVNLIGVKLDDPPNQRRRRRSEATNLDIDGNSPSPGSGISSRSRSRAGSVGIGNLDEIQDRPPPSWEEIDSERRRSEAAERRDLAKPITRDEGEESEMAIAQQDGGGNPGSSSTDKENTKNAEDVDVDDQDESSNGPSGESSYAGATPSTPTKERSTKPTGPKLSIPAHLAPALQVQPPTPVSRPSSGIA